MPLNAAQIRERLATNDRWLLRGLLAIYARQTSDEQQAEHTRYRNDVGFNGADSTILTRYAKYVKEWEAGRSKYRHPLSRQQLAKCREKMLKYAGQLARIAAEKEPQPV